MVKDEISEAELIDRHEALKNVLGTMAAEGELPSPEGIAIFERRARGEIDLTAMGTEVNQLVQAILQRAAA
jgi:hypothetical protein